MSKCLTIPELQDELRRLQQAYDNDDITGAEFEAGAADLHDRIKARELTLAKQKVARELDVIKATTGLDTKTWSEVYRAIWNAKTEAELNAIIPQNLAA